MKVAIVGLGFGGGSLALLLWRQGHQVHLWERAAEPGPVGAGILLQPSGQAVLERLGLLPQVLAHSQRFRALVARNQRGQVFMNLDLDELPTYGLLRGQLFEPLYSALGQTSVRLLTGREVLDVDPQGYLLDGQGWHGPFDLVVLADGSRSRLRARVCRPALDLAYDMGALWYCGQSRFPGDHLFQVSQGTRHLCGLLPTGQGGCSFFWACTPAEYAACVQDGFDAWKEQVRRLAPEAEELLQGLDPTRALYASYRHTWLPHWHRQHLVLLGDAAHSMSPHLGQGTNLALLDAFCLARSLEALPLQQALLRYQKVRQRQLRLYSGLSLLLTPFFQSRPDPGLSLGRDLALPLMLAVPWLRRAMRQSVYGLRASWLLGQRSLEELT